MHRNHLHYRTNRRFLTGYDLGRVNFWKKSLSFHSNVKSLTTMRHYNRPLEGNRRSRVPFNSSNEIYDYGAKVEWGSIDHEDRGWTRRSFRFRKRGEPAQVLLACSTRSMGHVKPQGRVPCNPFSGCPGGSHARRLATRSVFCRFSDANLLAFFALLRVYFI